MKYRKIGDYYFGSADFTIPELAEKYVEFFQGLSMLVTFRDSGGHVVRCFERMGHFKQRIWGIRAIGESVWVAPEGVIGILRDDRTFNGFDEIYLMKDAPTAGVTIMHHFTTERCNFEKAVPDEFVETFHRLGAVRFLSDGCDMNFCCESMEIVEGIRKAEGDI